jgi:hypothetical protein|tara:strand:- start:880 stop:1290 length:411 start_codon:yes stop_codon:yes gene_type:complete
MASTLFRGPVLVGKKNEAGVSGYNITQKDSSYTVVISTDSGKTFISKTKDVVFTLPAIAIGNTYTFINTGADGQNNLTISPNSSDGILYLGSLTDDKDVINTQSTSKVGDFVKIASLNSTVFWTVVEAQGVWAKES